MKNEIWPIIFFFRRFWVKEPRRSENMFAKKRYTSMIVARVCTHTAVTECMETRIRDASERLRKFTSAAAAAAFFFFLKWLGVTRSIDPRCFF